MANVTISFTIDEERLARVDGLATELDRDRSSTLRQIIDAGVPMVRSAHQVAMALRHPLPASAFPDADGDVGDDVDADMEMRDRMQVAALAVNGRR